MLVGYNFSNTSVTYLQSKESCGERAVPFQEHYWRGLSRSQSFGQDQTCSSPSVFAMPVFTLSVQMWLMRFSCSGLASMTILMFQRVWIAICRDGKVRGCISSCAAKLRCSCSHPVSFCSTSPTQIFFLCLGYAFSHYNQRWEEGPSYFLVLFSS